jgi:hypothetical protein
MTVIVSQSLYPVQAVERAFWHGNRYHCISAKVTLAFDAQGRLSELPRQSQFDLEEVWREQPMRSSLLRPGDLIPYKPTTDVLVVGTARPPGGRPAAQWDAALRFQGREKRLRLFGPRAWRHSLLSGWTLSSPEPTTGVALLYENAYGGVTDPSKAEFEEGDFYPDNPFGCGFVGRSRPDTGREHRAAQIEAWNGAIAQFGRNAAVGGLGPIPGFLPARAQHMGTWDVAGEKEHSPNIPLDMDMRYWQCAPEDQRASEYLRRGDVIELSGLASQPIRLQIPRAMATTLGRRRDGSHEARVMNLDTVLVDLDAKHLELRYHRILPIDPSMPRIFVDCVPMLTTHSVVAHG